MLGYVFIVSLFSNNLILQLGSDDSCFGDPLMLFTMKHLIGYEEAVMSSLRKLAINESLDGLISVS